MEILPRPVGTVKSIARDGSRATILVEGVTTISSGDYAPILQLGQQYYTNTMGAILAGNLYYGQLEASSEAITYIDLYDTENLIVSLDSVIGMAVSESTVLLGKKWIIEKYLS